MVDDEIKERVIELEKHRERVETRLDGGAKAFESVRKDLEELERRTAPKPLPVWQILGVVTGTLITVLTVWWQARGEIDAKANVTDVQNLVAPVQKEVQEQRVILTGVKATGENTSQVLGEMKSDVKADIAELKADIRAMGKGR